LDYCRLALPKFFVLADFVEEITVGTMVAFVARYSIRTVVHHAAKVSRLLNCHRALQLPPLMGASNTATVFLNRGHSQSNVTAALFGASRD
jgi:hypothetical protein